MFFICFIMRKNNMEKKLIDIIKDIESLQDEFIFNMEKFLMSDLVDNISPCTTNMILLSGIVKDIDYINFSIDLMLINLRQVHTFQTNDFTDKINKQLNTQVNQIFSIIQQYVNELNFFLGEMIDVDKNVDIKSFKEEISCNMNSLEKQFNKIKTFLKYCKK